MRVCVSRRARKRVCSLCLSLSLSLSLSHTHTRPRRARAQNGEVVRKRSIDPHSLRERFTRQALDSTKNVNGFAATLRRTDGTLRFVGRDALAMMTARWPPAEPTVAALQGYVAPAGSDGTVHVNKYGLKNDKGAVITSTYSYCSLPSADGSGGAASVAAQGSAAARSGLIREPVKSLQGDEVCCDVPPRENLLCTGEHRLEML